MEKEIERLKRASIQLAVFEVLLVWTLVVSTALVVLEASSIRDKYDGLRSVMQENYNGLPRDVREVLNAQTVVATEEGSR